MSLLLPSTLPASRKNPLWSTFSDLRASSSSPPSTSSCTSSFCPSPIPFFVCRASIRKRHRCRFAAIQLQTMSQSIEAVSAKSAEDLEEDFIPCRSFPGFRSEEELLANIDKESVLGTLPSNCSSIMRDLCHDYRNAVLQSGICDANEIVLSNMAALFDRILSDAKDPFFFPSYHKAIREPFDYYVFGQNFIRPLIDFKKSFLGNMNIFGAMKADVEQGHNVILISNHQTEADPAIITLLLQKFHPSVAEDLTYVAGDRVLTDVICKPFSMGRNLICVYSKKHMFDDPANAAMKKAANLRSLKEMAALLSGASGFNTISHFSSLPLPKSLPEQISLQAFHFGSSCTPERALPLPGYITISEGMFVNAHVLGTR